MPRTRAAGPAGQHSSSGWLWFCGLSPHRPCQTRIQLRLLAARSTAGCRSAKDHGEHFGFEQHDWCSQRSARPLPAWATDPFVSRLRACSGEMRARRPGMRRASSQGRVAARPVARGTLHFFGPPWTGGGLAGGGGLPELGGTPGPGGVPEAPGVPGVPGVPAPGSPDPSPRLATGFFHSGI